MTWKAIDMSGSNEPKQFTLTPENVLEVLMEWLPDQLSAMRQYESGDIKIDDRFSSLQCRYMQTIGGEKFRIFDFTPFGASASEYYPPLGSDDDIIIALSKRIEGLFASIEKRNRIMKSDPRPLELTMCFSPGPFETEPTASVRP